MKEVKIRIAAQSLCVECGRLIQRRKGGWSHARNPQHVARPAETVTLASGDWRDSAPLRWVLGRVR